MDEHHEPPPRSHFEVNTPRLLGRAAMLLGIIFVVGGFVGLSHLFDSTSYLATIGSIGIAVVGFFLIYIGMQTLLKDTSDEPKTGFVAWGRLLGGVVLTILALAGRIAVRYFPDAPSEAVVPPAMMLIAGPVLMAWASYATFVLDADQADTGALLIVLFLALIPVLFML